MKKEGNKSIIAIIVVILGITACCIISCIGAFFFLRATTDGIEFIDNPPYFPPFESIEEDPVTYIPINGTQHIDDKWGYTIGIPHNWPNYTVEKKESSAAGFMMASHEFVIKSSDGLDVSFFTISIYTHEQWDNVLYGEEKVGENDDYVFAFSRLNGTPPSDLDQYIKDLDDIKASFKLL